MPIPDRRFAWTGGIQGRPATDRGHAEAGRREVAELADYLDAAA